MHFRTFPGGRPKAAECRNLVPREVNDACLSRVLVAFRISETIMLVPCSNPCSQVITVSARSKFPKELKAELPSSPMGTLWVEQTSTGRSKDSSNDSSAGKATGSAHGADCNDQSREEGGSKRLDAAQSVPVDVKRSSDGRRNGDAVSDCSRSGQDGDDRHNSSNRDQPHDKSTGEPLPGEQHQGVQDALSRPLLGNTSVRGRLLPRQRRRTRPRVVHVPKEV